MSESSFEKRLFGIGLLLILFSNILLAQPTRLPVTVSIQPQVYFLEKIGGERIDVNLLVPAGKDPHSYSPTPRQVAKLAKSKVLFLIGVPFEQALLPKIRTIAKNTTIIKTQNGIEKNGGDDPHIWLNPSLIIIQAKTILQALIQHDVGGKAYYEERYHQFIKEIEESHIRIKARLDPLKGKMFFSFHSSFGWFAEAYELKQKTIEEGGKRPKARELLKLIKRAKKDKVRVVFVQPQFDQNAARKVARAINGVVVALDPLAKDVLLNLDTISQSIQKALKVQ